MSNMSKSIFVVFAFACLSFPVGVFAEGSDEIPNQMLDNAVVVIEIVDFTIETFVWTGPGTVSLSPPVGIPVTLSSGQIFVPTQNGDFSMVVSNKATFDFSVKDDAGKEIPGRVSSILWELSQGSDLSENLNGSFFAAIPSGIADTAVIELKLEGFNGIGYSIAGNGVGVNGPNAGRSVPFVGNTLTPEYRMYLNPPDQASYSAIIPNISAMNFTPTGAIQDCDLTQAGASSGTFTFTSDAEGTYHLICDLNNDGDFSLNDGNDLFLIGATTIGSNTISWDGTNSGNNGSQVAIGNYNCKLEVTTGEFHFAVGDAEYSFPGLRLFEVSAARVKRGLPMHWNDGLLLPRNSDPILDDGSNTVDFSPTGGVLPGNYDDPAVPFTTENINGTARAWGHSVNGKVTNGTGNTKGNNAFLDTFTWVEESRSLNVSFAVVDPTLDGDMDGLSDYEEACLTGTNPLEPDSDFDGVDDGIEVFANGGSVLSPTDTDGDGVNDALETCSDGYLSGDACDDGNAIDGDGCTVLCTIELGFNCATPGQPCTDIDECADATDNCDPVGICTNNISSFSCACPLGYLDVNGDGTRCVDIDECANGTDTCDANASCTNAPGIFVCQCRLGYAGDGENCAPADSDQDGILDFDECSDLSAPDSCEDFDGDSVPDFLDLDSDNDGILDSMECTTQPCQNTDSNGGQDFRDLDSDGDGITDAFEAGYDDIDGDGRPDDFVDNDGDGRSDLEPLEPTDSDDDGLPDFQSTNSDNDVILDAVEGQDSDNNGFANVAPVGIDTDGDGIDDAFDPDCENAGSCGGVIGTIASLSDFDQDGIADFQDVDSDGDGITDRIECGPGVVCKDSDADGNPDYLDIDSDNDSVPDSIEGHDVDADGRADTLPSGNDTDGDGLDDAYDLDCSNVAVCSGIVGNAAATPNRDNDRNPDYQDSDDDNDGILTLQEVNDGILHGDDPDNDGIPAYLDLDSDGDNTSDMAEGTIDPATGILWDLDNDGIPDYLDPNSSPIDTDRDGIPDTIECQGAILNCVDSDADGLPDFQDIDDDNDGITTRVESMDDSAGNDRDGDGTPNHLDLDSDGDGIPDLFEGHEEEIIPSGNDADQDGLDDAFDADNGGITATTPDADGDGLANYLDNDDDGDGIATAREDDDDLNPRNDDKDGDGVPNYLDLDSDGDGIPDRQECTKDPCEDGDDDGVPNYLDGDSDNDGILDIIEGHLTGTRPTGFDSNEDGLDDGFQVDGEQPDPVDTDTDGTPDYLDLDSDNDRVQDLVEGHEGTPSVSGIDTDNDGVDDTFDPDNGGIEAVTPDLDGDGVPNYRDTDDDDDGTLTIDEDANGDGDPSNDDEDGDGIPDYLDSADPLSLGGGSCSSIHSSPSLWLVLFGFVIGVRRRRK